MTALSLPVSPDLRRRAITVAIEVADRLRSPESVIATARRVRRPAGHPGWDATALPAGHPGIALVHATMSVAEPSFAAATHAHLAAAAPGPAADLVPAVVLHTSVHGGYPKLLRSLAHAVAESCEERVATHARRAEPGADHGGVRGLAGVGRLLLALGDDHCGEALDTLLRHLVSRTRPVAATAQPDVGLANGLAAPLALMALAHDRGHRVEGMADAMRALVDPLLRAVGDEGDEAPSPDAAASAAWCRGTAGVARALHLAGIALGDAELCGAAVRALRGVVLRPWSQARLVGPTVCHGLAGLLQVVLRVSEHDPDPVLRAAAGVLAQRLLYSFDRTAPFGFRHAYRTRAGRFVAADEPGLLTGAAGVTLALATFAHHPGTVGPDVWDAPLLLS